MGADPVLVGVEVVVIAVGPDAFGAVSDEYENAVDLTPEAFSCM
jgi:hypothetical protein